jgi:hypothetical protein
MVLNVMMEELILSMRLRNDAGQCQNVGMGDGFQFDLQYCQEADIKSFYDHQPMQPRATFPISTPFAHDATIIANPLPSINE